MNKAHHWLMIVITLVLLGGWVFFIPSHNNAGKTSSKVTAPEIKAIFNLKSTQEQGVELKKLLERVGPVETQEEMLASGLPFTGETHLLIHVIGDYIYDKYGLDGLPLCREYFLSACYHGFIINALADHGLDGVATAMDKCAEAGGNIVAIQCAHAAGHGFVAWHDYDLLKALKTCDELGSKVTNFGYFNCYDGVFMENIWGVHNGAPSEKRWIKDDNLYYPCNDPRIPEKYLNGCWSNQATLMYQHFHGDLKKTAEACDAVENAGYRDTCYNNFSRQIHPLTEGQTTKVLSLCALATGEGRQNECTLINMTSYWSVGDHELPFEICGAVSDSIKGECFSRLAGLIKYYYPNNPAERKSYCDKVTDKTSRQICAN